MQCTCHRCRLRYGARRTALVPESATLGCLLEGIQMCPGRRWRHQQDLRLRLHPKRALQLRGVRSPIEVRVLYRAAVVWSVRYTRLFEYTLAEGAFRNTARSK